MIESEIKRLTDSGIIVPEEIKQTFIAREKAIENMDFSNSSAETAKSANVCMMKVQIEMHKKYGHMVF